MDFALILDCVVLVILVISSVVAFLRGFVREVLTILGLGGAAITALTAGPMLAPGIENWLTDGKTAEEAGKMWGFVPYDIAASVFAYAGLFVITLILMSLVSHWIAKSVHAIGLGPVDRSLGVVFGIIRALVLIGLLYMPFHLLMEEKDKQEWFGDAVTISYVEYTADIMSALMPESLQRDESDKDDDDADPLKNLTGEENEPGKTGDPQSLPDTGTDEEEASRQQESQSSGTGYRNVQRQAIDALIENQDKIKDIVNGDSAKPDAGRE